MDADKEALLVVDVDHYNGWAPDVVEKNPDRITVKSAIVRVLQDWRAHNGIILHVISTNSATGFSGQEAQIGIEQIAKETLQGESQKQEQKCLVCHAGEKYRLAEFVGHRCDIEPAFVKQGSDAFSNVKILEYLNSKGVNPLFLTGCFTNDCILATAAGALKAGFKVILLADALFPMFRDRNREKEWLDCVIRDLPPEACTKISVARIATTNVKNKRA